MRSGAYNHKMVVYDCSPPLSDGGYSAVVLQDKIVSANFQQIQDLYYLVEDVILLQSLNLQPRDTLRLIEDSKGFFNKTDMG